MNMTKRIFSAILVVAMLTATAATATAVSPLQMDIQPRYTGVTSDWEDLNIEASSGIATATVTVHASPGYTVKVYISLMRDSGTLVRSWDGGTGGGSVKFQKTCYVSPGHDYYVLASISVFDQSGKEVDSFEKPSTVQSY